MHFSSVAYNSIFTLLVPIKTDLIPITVELPCDQGRLKSNRDKKSTIYFPWLSINSSILSTNHGYYTTFNKHLTGVFYTIYDDVCPIKNSENTSKVLGMVNELKLIDST